MRVRSPSTQSYWAEANCLRKLAQHALADAEKALQFDGCDLVGHGESLPSDKSEKTKAVACAAALPAGSWSR